MPLVKSAVRHSRLIRSALTGYIIAKLVVPIPIPRKSKPEGNKYQFVLLISNFQVLYQK